MSNVQKCVDHHLGNGKAPSNSPIAPYRKAMLGDANELIAKGVPEADAWARVITRKLKRLNAEKARITGLVNAAYAETPEGREEREAVETKEVKSDVVPAGLTISFGGKTYPVDSINDAQAKWIAFRDATGAGVSKTGNGLEVKDGAGRFVARISYNGRVFDGRGDDAKVIAEPPDGGPMPEGVRADTAQTYIPPKETLEQARERSGREIDRMQAEREAIDVQAKEVTGQPELTALRKRESVLKQLLECLAS